MRSRHTVGWALLVSALALAVCCGMPTGARASSVDSAVAYQLDANHDGYQTTPITAPLTRLWSDPLPSPAYSDVTSAPLIVNGVVYITSNGSLYAIQQATGQTLWSKSMVGTYDVLTIGYDAGEIFALNFGGVLTAVNATTGSTVWAAQMPRQYEFQYAPVAAGGVVYVTGGGMDGTLYAVSESTGSVLWTQDLESGDGSVAVDGGELVASEACDYFDGFDAFTGTPLWADRGDCDGGGGVTPVAVDGDVFTPSGFASSGEILSEATGSSLGTLGTSMAPAVANGVIYTVSGDTLTAVSDAGLGINDWSFTSTTGAFVDAPLIVGNLVFAVSAGGTIYALDATNGTEDWSDATGETITGEGEYANGGIASGENTVVVPTSNALIAYAGANAGSGVPANTVPATVVGTPIVNQPVGADVGVWTGLPTSYSYQWLDCSANGASCNPISGGTTEGYVPTSAQLGTTLEVSVVATNADGASAAYISAPSEPVGLGSPENTSLPSISGDAVVGDTLTASPGTWSPMDESYEYQWLQCSSSTVCEPIGSPTVSDTYTVGAGTVGATIAVEVVATYGSGGAVATSPQTTTVKQAFATTTMTLRSSENPAPVGATVTFTATLSSVVDGGTLSFSQNGTPIDGCSDASMDVVVKFVTCTVEAANTGTVVIKASYSGDADYGASAASVSQVIGASVTTTTGTNTTTTGTTTTSTATTPTVTRTTTTGTTSTPTGTTTTGTTSTPTGTTTTGTTTTPTSTSTGITTTTTPDTSTITPAAASTSGAVSPPTIRPTIKTTELPLGAPHDVRARKTRGGYTVTWKRLSGARSYRLTITIAGRTTTRTLSSASGDSYVAVASHERAEISLCAIGKNGARSKPVRLHI